MQIDIPQKLIEQIALDNCVVFVGAGPSMGVGLPSWPQLLQRMVAWCESHGISLSDKADIEGIIEKKDLTNAADVLRDRMGDNKYQEFMEEIFLRPDFNPTEVHLLLAEIPFAAAATTNYDGLVESGYRAIHPGDSFEVFTQVDYEQMSKVLRDKRYFVLKAHGTIERFDTVVLAESDYNRLIHESPGYRAFLRALFTSRTVLFIGFGLTDPELALLLKELKTIFKADTVPHYALMDVTEVSPAEQQQFAKTSGVKIIPYKPAAPDHPEVKLFLAELLQKVNQQAVWYRLEETKKAVKDDNPHYRVVFTTKDEFYVEPKHPGATEQYPLGTSVKLHFDKTTPEGREAHEAMKRREATGEAVTIKGAHIADVEMPEIMRRHLPDVTEHLEISIGVTRGTAKPRRVKVTVECEDGEKATLDNILLENVQRGSEQSIWSNENQDVPWKFKQVIRRDNEDVADFSFTLADDVGLPVKQALEELLFSRALSKGGVLRIEDLDTGEQRAHTQVEPGTFESPDPRWIRMLEALLFIQTKTGVRFTSPEKVSDEEANAVFSVVRVLKSGRLEFDLEPYISSATIEQARETLTKFARGQTVAISQYLEEWFVPVLGQVVELGPAVITCKQFYITPEDLDTLSKAVEAASSDEMIELRFTPVPGVKVEAEFPDLLPADEAERVRNLPFVRMNSLKNLAKLLFESAKLETGSFDVDQFMSLLVEAREQKSRDGKPLNPLSSAKPEELQAAFNPLLAEMSPEDKLRLALKLSEQGWLTVGEAAHLIGVNEDTLSQECSTPDQRSSIKKGGDQARSAGSEP